MNILYLHHFSPTLPSIIVQYISCSLDPTTNSKMSNPEFFNKCKVINLILSDPSFRPAPLTSFYLVFAWPSFGQHIFWVSNITLFCPAFQKVFVYYRLPWPVVPPSKISIYFEFLTLPSFVQHSKKFLFTIVKFVSL